MWGNRAYFGMGRVIKEVAPQAHDLTQYRASSGRPLTQFEEHMNRVRSKVRSRVEHAFGVLKCVIGFRKVSYKGLAKNANRLQTTAALVNLYMIGRQLA